MSRSGSPPVAVEVDFTLAGAGVAGEGCGGGSGSGSAMRSYEIGMSVSSLSVAPGIPPLISEGLALVFKSAPLPLVGLRDRVRQELTEIPVPWQFAGV